MLNSLLTNLVFNQLSGEGASGDLSGLFANNQGINGRFLEQLEKIFHELGGEGREIETELNRLEPILVPWAPNPERQGFANNLSPGGEVLPSAPPRILTPLAATALQLQSLSGSTVNEDSKGLRLQELLSQTDLTQLAESVKERVATPKVVSSVEAIAAIQATDRLSTVSSVLPSETSPTLVEPTSGHTGVENPAVSSHRAAGQTVPAVDVPLNHTRWNQTLGQRVIWMANQESPSAAIQLNPPHLGPLEVQLSVDGDRAQLNFLAHHGSVRDAVEGAIPRLREMLMAVGLTQVDVNVSQHGSSQNGRDGGSGSHHSPTGTAHSSSQGAVLADASGAVSALPGLNRGLVDYYI